MSKYVIRGYHWGYNDEAFYPSGSYIKSVFDDETAARRELLKLEREHWAEMDLGETSEFFNGGQGLLQKANAFIRQKVGEDLFEDLDDPRDAFIPDSLNDEDYAAFLHLAGLEAFKLVVFDGDPVFYALWCYQDESYLMEYDECGDSLVHAVSIDELQSEFDDVMCDYLDEFFGTLCGPLSSLSDTPSILDEFLKKAEGFSWDATRECLRVDSPEGAEILALNDLLKTPFFRVDKLSLEEVQQKTVDPQEDCFY